MKSDIVKSIEDKIGWLERSYKKLNDNKTEYLEIQDSFWSFLSSIQQIKYYFSKLITDTNIELSKNKKSELIKEKLDEWKKNTLVEEEVSSWNMLNDLRNKDTHDEPVMTNYEIKYFNLSDGMGNVISAGNGLILSLGLEGYYIKYENKEYEIKALSKNGLVSSKKLLNYLKTEF